ncbi:MAG TPA: hypothetical protein VLF93_02140 [Candidatus Saccharimonadales bacterium]|nr:hypothetical protein [Candidatus Saccharimonadales bacterium]
MHKRAITQPGIGRIPSLPEMARGGDGAVAEVTILGPLKGKTLITGTVAPVEFGTNTGRCCGSKPCSSDIFKECK